MGEGFPFAADKQVEASIEIGDELRQRADTELRRGELDRQGQSIETRAECRDSCRVSVIQREARVNLARPLREESHRGTLGDIVDARRLHRRQSQRLHRQDVLAADAETLTTGGQDSHLRAFSEQVGNCGSSRDHLLDVVENEEEALVTQPVHQRLAEIQPTPFAHADCGGDSGENHVRFADRPEPDEPDAILEIVDKIGRCLQREVGLADSTRADEGNEPRAVCDEQVGYRGELVLPSQERRRQRRQVGRVAFQRLQRREFVWADQQ